MFTLNQRLKDDTVEVTSLGLSVVLLMKDRTLPWLVLVPKREGVREVYELDQKDRLELVEEIALCSRVLKALYSPFKINIGALGNLVPQLHIHVVGRFESDRAWPGPVWGASGGAPYPEDELQRVAGEFKEAFERLSSAHT